MIELDIKDLVKNYGIKNVLDGLSFEVKSGERVALIGQNGCGKSTVLNTINGDETIDGGRVNIRNGASIKMLKQIYEKRDIDCTVEEFLMENFSKCFELEKKLKCIEEEMATETNDNLLQKLINKYGRIQDEYVLNGGYEIQEKYKKICSGFKYDDLFLCSMYNTLSGGERTKVNLAKILMSNPDILLLDEPTNHLDVDTLEWLEELLSSYSGTILVISHDRYFLDKIATKTVLIESGKAKIYHGNYSYFLEEDERRTLAEFEKYKSQQKQIEKMKDSIKTLRKFGDIAQNEMFYKRAKSIEKRLEKMDVLEKVDIDKKKSNINLVAGDRSANDVIKVEHLFKNFGDKNIFNDFNMNVYRKEKVCITGKNGSGKSTLIKMIIGEGQGYSGKIELGSNTKIGYIPQELNFKNKEETILEYILNNTNMGETEARTYLAKFSFYGENVFKRIRELSGGEKVRLILAKLMRKNINLLVLDEPTNHLDIASREALEESLKSYDGTVLFVSHDRYFIKKISTRMIKI
ncbi:MAG: ABC-F family ATP-binding cassette domain-containing protein [Clostridia bacterium]|nr:ABC-F family ATP-binding cassette domain-containing protein [Clostridia bacterium]